MCGRGNIVCVLLRGRGGPAGKGTAVGVDMIRYDVGRRKTRLVLEACHVMRRTFIIHATRHPLQRRAE